MDVYSKFVKSSADFLWNFNHWTIKRKGASTEWMLQNLKPECKMKFAGDGTMGPAVIWLNPIHERLWDDDAGTRTIGIIREKFSMYPLTVRGLEEGIKELLAKAL